MGLWNYEWQSARESATRELGSAVEKLVEIGAPTAFPLSRLLTDSSRRYRYRIEEVLKRVGADAVEPLFQVLQTGDCQAQIHAIAGLGVVGDRRALRPLQRALGSPFVQVRRAAAQALWNKTDSESVEPLIRCLEDDDLEVREAAARLGETGDERAVEPLLEMLEHPEW